MLMHRRDSGPKISKQGDTRQAAPAAGDPGAGIGQPGISDGDTEPPGISLAGITGRGIGRPGITRPGIGAGGITRPGITRAGVAGSAPRRWGARPRDGQSSGGGAGRPGEARKGWTLPELTGYVRQNWPISQRGLRDDLKTHPRGGAAQRTVVDAIRNVRAEKEPSQARHRAVND